MSEVSGFDDDMIESIGQAGNAADEDPAEGADEPDAPSGGAGSPAAAGGSAEG
jgi:hypothetical protein